MIQDKQPSLTGAGVKGVVFVDSVPKTAVAKLNRKALQDMLAG